MTVRFVNMPHTYRFTYRVSCRFSWNF